MSISQPILLALKWYLKYSPIKRGAGIFLRLIDLLNKAGCQSPVVITKNGDKLYFHHKDVLLISIMVSGVFEEAQTKLLKNFSTPGGVFIDVGANIGYYSLAASSWVGKQGHVYSFEPLPKTNGYLKKNILLNGKENISIYPYACSSSNGKAKMVVGKESGWSRLGYKNEGDTVVKLITLDSFIQKNNITSVDVIKIDTEGADFEVIKGATETIRKFKPVILLEVEHIHNYGSSIEEAQEFFRAQGYDTSLIKDVHSLDMFCTPKQ